MDLNHCRFGKSDRLKFFWKKYHILSQMFFEDRLISYNSQPTLNPFKTFTVT